jgi:hypothetical protein
VSTTVRSARAAEPECGDQSQVTRELLPGDLVELPRKQSRLVIDGNRERKLWALAGSFWHKCLWMGRKSAW